MHCRIALRVLNNGASLPPLPPPPPRARAAETAEQPGMLELPPWLHFRAPASTLCPLGDRLGFGACGYTRETTVGGLRAAVKFASPHGGSTVTKVSVLRGVWV